jgi:hypothetical protein
MTLLDGESALMNSYCSQEKEVRLECGKHLAKSWKASRSANEASLAIFFQQKKRVLKDVYVSEAVVCS